MIRSESFRAGLRRSYLDRRPVVNQPTVFLESLRSNEISHLPKTFGVKIEHDVCANVRRCSESYPDKINAPAHGRFSTQRASSLSRGGEVALYGYVVVQNSNHLKALSISDFTGG